MAILILLSILILSSVIGSLLILNKINEKSKLPDVNITVKTPPVEITNTVGNSSDPDESNKSEEFKWRINPLNYIEKSNIEAHINWPD